VPVRHRRHKFARIGCVIAHARFLEQGWIGGEAGYPRLFGHLDDLGLIGTIRKQLDFQLYQGWRVHLFLALQWHCSNVNIERSGAAIQCAGELIQMEPLPAYWR
jgi:hypothetical protein